MGMPNFYKFSIRYKMIAVMLLIGSIVLTLASSAFLINNMIKFRQTMVENLMSQGELVALSNDAALFFGMSESTSETLPVLSVNKHLVAVYLFTLDGNIFGAYHRSKADQKAQPDYKTFNQFYFDSSQPHRRLELESATYFFRNQHLDLFKPVYFDGKIIGSVYLRSDMEAFWDYMVDAGVIVAMVLIAALLLTVILASAFQRLMTRPVYLLLSTMESVVAKGDYSLRSEKCYDDELGTLCDGFNHMLSHVEARDKELAEANTQINKLNTQLEAENSRLGAELDVAQQLQTMVLPRQEELKLSQNLDIAGFMCPADEVGGDYYDVLRHPNGWVKFAIGDVTGHGLESGVVMLMVQTATRTLLEYGVTDAKQFLSVLNRTIYRNVQRMGSDKMLTLSLLDYHEEDAVLNLSGQHEDVIVIRNDGRVECLDTFPLGFFIGLQADIDEFIGQCEIQLAPGDCVVLHTDGVTEAFDESNRQYGIERLCYVACEHRQKTAAEMQQAIIQDLTQHMGECHAIDDITLMVIKQQ